MQHVRSGVVFPQKEHHSAKQVGKTQSGYQRGCFFQLRSFLHYNTKHGAPFSAQKAPNRSCGTIFLQGNHQTWLIVHYCSCGDSTTFPMIPHAGTGRTKRKHAKVNKTFSYQCHIRVTL